MNYRQTQVQRSVFRAYDIRGLIGEQLNENDFYTIGRAISSRLISLQRHKIYIARDGRLTSNQLATALKQGLLDSGITVIDLGEVATPVMYFAVNSTDLDCGLMVTGSHNPADYNGIKMVLAGKTLVQQDINELYDLIEAGIFPNGEGEERSHDILPDYIQRILSDIKLHRALKVVVDCGNGIAGPVVPKILEALGCEIIPLFCEVDGRFPNHHPDPTIETNLVDLKAAVAKHKADIGLAFDGDADRLGVITNQGQVIWPDRLLMLYAKDLLSRRQGSTIVFDVKCSSNLPRIIQEGGGIAKMCPTGHSIVKGIMKEENAVLAGEMSGHIFFKDRWYGFDDALYSACRLLEILSLTDESVHEQFNRIPNSINTPEIKIPIAEEEKFLFMQRFSKQAQFPDARVNTIDGMRVEFANGWGLLRASNTTPCLVARFEASDQEALEEIQLLFKKQLQFVDKNLILSF